MPVVMHLRRSTFIPLAALEGLVAMAAGHELVLVGCQAVLPAGRLAALRQALAPHRMHEVLVDDHVPVVERLLIDELLDDGHIPVILTSGESRRPALTSWLWRRPDRPGTAR